MVIILLINGINIYNLVVLKKQISLICGYGSAVILTGSMEPHINVGDLIIIHAQKTYELDDIVTYSGNTQSVTHRIVEETTSGYITKGDANGTSDGEIAKDRIIGKVIKIIPNGGKVISFLQNPIYLVILFLCLFIVERTITFINKKLEERSLQSAES